MNADRKKILSLLPQLVLVLLFVGASVYIALSPPASLMNWYNNDDGFFYFKAAQHIAAGQGSTFDGINPTNGYHPLWMLVCVVVFWLFRADLLTPLRVIVVLFGVMQAVSAVLVYEVLKDRLGKLLSFILTAGFFSCWVVFNNTFSGGLESALSCMMTVIVWSMAIQYRDRGQFSFKGLLLVGLAGGLTVLSRLDNLIFVAFLGIWLVFDQRRDRGMLTADLLAAMILTAAVSIWRAGYDVYTIQREVLAMVFLLAAGTIGFSALTGLFSFKGLLKQGCPSWLKIGITWLSTAAVLWAGIFLLNRVGFISVFSKSILAALTAIWLVYIVISRLLNQKQTEEAGGLDVWPVLRGWILKPVGYFLPVLLVFGAYLIWSQVNFHTPMPVSGQIKQWWGTLGSTTYGSPIRTATDLQDYLLGVSGPFGLVYNLPFVRVFNPEGSNWKVNAGFWLVLALVAGLGLWLVRKNQPTLKIPALALPALALAGVYRIAYFYIVGYVHLRSWYWTVESLFDFILLAGVVWIWFAVLKANPVGRWLVWIAAAAVLLWQGQGMISGLSGLYNYSQAARTNEDYLGVARLLQADTEDGAIIGTPGGGSLSYFIQNRTIVNLDGLMNSKEYFDALRKYDTRPLMNRMGIQYIFASDYTITSSPPYKPIFDGCLQFDQQVYGKVLYRYTCQQDQQP
jgi:hypothetical protein